MARVIFLYQILIHDNYQLPLVDGLYLGKLDNEYEYAIIGVDQNREGETK